MRLTFEKPKGVHEREDVKKPNGERAPVPVLVMPLSFCGLKLAT